MVSDKAPEPNVEGWHENSKELTRIYRKLDRRIIPALWVLYFLIASIRSTVGLSLTMNTSNGHSLGQYLHLSEKQISTGVALFYVSYVVFDTPANLVMTMIAPQAWLSRIVVTVGIVGACHAAMSSAWSFYLLRFLLGMVMAGIWPGMSYYLTLWYPPSQCAHRIGYYFTAAQLSAAVAGLVSAGFQLMDGVRGLTGYQWMFLLWGLLGVTTGLIVLWWLPDRPGRTEGSLKRLVPRQVPPLTPEESAIHQNVMAASYTRKRWGWLDVWHVLLDWRLWPLMIMYFGPVGTGIGIQNYGTLIIRAINPSLTSIQLSLLFAPIWIMDGIGILVITPFSDKFHNQRNYFFSGSAMIIVAGLFMTTYAPNPWARYGGLLLAGFGLGPTIPITMTWTSEVFSSKHGEVGVAISSALVSGLGNLGSVTTTYALYTGWPNDVTNGYGYRNSNLVMIGLLFISIVSSFVMMILLKLIK